MSSIKKISSIIMVITIAMVVFSISEFVYFDKQYSVDDEIILAQIKFSAIYFEDKNVVVILFEDGSNNTESATLEILGMDVTYHKEYVFDVNSSFVTEMYLEQIPKYGWKTTPVTLEIQHTEFGKIGLKTEIIEENGITARIIVEQK